MSQYSQCVQERRTRGQQTADMVSGSELVIDDDTESRYLVHPFNAVNRTRQLSCRSSNPARSKTISFDFAQFNVHTVDLSCVHTGCSALRCGAAPYLV